MADTCHFCRRLLAGQRSREHVFAQWLLDLTDHRRVQVVPTHQSFDGDVVSQRTHTFDNLVLGGVCECCNSEWMSLIDNASKKSLTALWRGAAVATIDSEGRRALALWAAKTTYTLNLASNYRRIVPGAHLDALYENPRELPVGVVVVGESCMTNDGLGWAQSQNWYAHVDVREIALARAIEESSYKTTLRIGASVLTTCFWPNDDWMLTLRSERHVLLGGNRDLLGWDVAAGHATSNHQHFEHAFEIQVLSPLIVSSRSSDNGWLLGPNGSAEAILKRIDVRR